MTTQFTHRSDGNTLIIGASNSALEYIVWRFDDEEPSAIYFEYDGEDSGEFNNIEEVTVMHDGIHIVLKSSDLLHFYFNLAEHSEYEHFVSGLQMIYKDSPNILDIID
jgi:hypothetical protein